MKIRNGSIALNVTEDGDPSAPPLLMLHGITSLGGTWNWFVPELAERFRVLRLDFRGHGESDRSPGDYASSGYVSDAVAVCNEICSPCVVIGHSLGGATAAALAQQHPALVRAAIMEDPPLGLTRNAADPLEGNALLDVFRLMRQSIPMLQAANLSQEAVASTLAAAPSATGGLFGEMLHPDGIAQMAASMLAVDASVLDPVIGNAMEPFLDETKPFEVPSLIVCADPAKQDAVASPQLARRFADQSPATEVQIIEGAGHLIHDELASRGTFRDMVVDFLDRLDT